MEVLGSPQGLLACIFRHKVQLLEAPDSSACASSLLFLIKWAVEPQVRSPQEATAALTAVSIILKQFREPSTVSHDSSRRDLCLDWLSGVIMGGERPGRDYLQSV